MKFNKNDIAWRFSKIDQVVYPVRVKQAHESCNQIGVKDAIVYTAIVSTGELMQGQENWDYANNFYKTKDECVVAQIKKILQKVKEIPDEKNFQVESIKE